MQRPVTVLAKRKKGGLAASSNLEKTTFSFGEGKKEKPYKKGESWRKKNGVQGS